MRFVWDETIRSHKSSFPHFRQLFALLICGFLLSARRPRARAVSPKVEDFSESTLVISAAKYLGTTAESMAEIMDKVFSQYGIPDAIIRGEEVSAAVVFGLRYGRGTLEMRSGAQHRFTGGAVCGRGHGRQCCQKLHLVYGIQNVEEVYSRFGGLTVGLLSGRVAVNYLQRDDIVMHQCAPALVCAPVSASDI